MSSGLMYAKGLKELFANASYVDFALGVISQVLIWLAIYRKTLLCDMHDLFSSKVLIDGSCLVVREVMEIMVTLDSNMKLLINIG